MGVAQKQCARSEGARLSGRSWDSASAAGMGAWHTASGCAQRAHMAAPSRNAAPRQRRPGRARRTKKPRATWSHGAVEKEVGSALLSRAPERSIIAAGALNGRVRDGNGCFSPARAANQRVSAGKHTEGQPCPAGRQRPRPPALIAPRPAPAYAGVAAGAADKPHGLSEPLG